MDPSNYLRLRPICENTVCLLQKIKILITKPQLCHLLTLRSFCWVKNWKKCLGSFQGPNNYIFYKKGIYELNLVHSSDLIRIVTE